MLTTILGGHSLAAAAGLLFLMLTPTGGKIAVVVVRKIRFDAEITKRLNCLIAWQLVWVDPRVDSTLFEEYRLSIAAVVHHVVSSGSHQQAHCVQPLIARRRVPNAIHAGRMKQLPVCLKKRDFRPLGIAPIAVNVKSGEWHHAARRFDCRQPGPFRRLLNTRQTVIECRVQRGIGIRWSDAQLHRIEFTISRFVGE